MNDNDKDLIPPFTGEPAGRSEPIAPLIHMDPEPTVIEDTEFGGEEAPVDGPPKWNGEELHPFNMGRRALWAQHRLSVGAPRIAACLEDLDAFAADAARILWLCSHDPKDWGELRCSPVDFEEAICVWADEMIPVEKTAEAIRVAVLLYARALPDKTSEN